jgi:asparagine synthase (glutamine-hydrolysing)
MGFRRLSILDLSPAGHQPMVSSTGRYVITFNGEIYNFRDLRRELESEGLTFVGQSDTEVMLGAIERWGCEQAVHRFRGMFAFALWDRQERALWLARDRMGIKPLYLAHRDGNLAYASEARALRSCPFLTGRGNSASARAMLAELYVPGPGSILEGVQRVSPGELIRFRIGDKGAERVDRVSYWRLEDLAETGRAQSIPNPDEAVDRLHDILREAVRLRMIADVPIGAFLSGGVDSSVVVAIMQESSPRPIKTFTIGFDEGAYDESAAARDVATQLGTDHVSVDFSTREAMELVTSLPGLSDEPMANPSLLPTLLLSRVARRDVVVALSGDGGDELFAGYNRYAHGARLIRRTHWMPRIMRHAVGAVVRTTATSSVAARTFAQLQPRSFGSQQSASERWLRAAQVIDADGSAAAYRALMSVGLQNVRPGVSASAWRDIPSLALEQRMMLADQARYLPDDLLTKVDRASMWASLEARVPILDQEVVRYSWRLPLQTMTRGGVTKWPLRQIALRYLDSRTINRPKMGFTVPIASWLRGGLREWAQDTLSDARVLAVGVLTPSLVRGLWRDFHRGQFHLALPLWSAAVLHSWSHSWKVTFEESGAGPQAND